MHWSIVNKIIRKKNTNEKDFIDITKDGKTNNDKANGFNEFFTNIGPNLANKIPETLTYQICS